MTSQSAGPVNESMFLNELRSATETAHKQLEDLPVSRALTSSQITVHDYTTYLQLMYSINSDVEENIYPQISDLFSGMSQRNKAHLIEKDLHFLKVIPTQKERPLTSINDRFSDEFAVGIMYVIEGSTLGGRYILKSIEKHLGLTEMEGCSYFAGYRSDTGRLWKTFLNELTTYATAHNQTDIIEGAVFAFKNIHDYMFKKTGSSL